MLSGPVEQKLVSDGARPFLQRWCSRSCLWAARRSAGVLQAQEEGGCLVQLLMFAASCTRALLLCLCVLKPVGHSKSLSCPDVISVAWSGFANWPDTAACGKQLWRWCRQEHPFLHVTFLSPAVHQGVESEGISQVVF